MSGRTVSVLLVEDNVIEQEAVRRAFKREHIGNPIITAVDGIEALALLRGGKGGVEALPRPYLILLDLNMPRMDGREALKVIKGDPDLRRIPIIVLTTSKAEEDIFRTYDLGVNSFIIKPVLFDSLVHIMRVLEMYWFEIVEISPN